jgi:hypothetical protein
MNWGFRAEPRVRGETLSAERGGRQPGAVGEVEPIAPQVAAEAHHSGLAEQCAPLCDAPGGSELEGRKAVKV